MPGVMLSCSAECLLLIIYHNKASNANVQFKLLTTFYEAAMEAPARMLLLKWEVHVSSLKFLKHQMKCNSLQKECYWWVQTEAHVHNHCLFIKQVWQRFFHLLP